MVCVNDTETGGTVELQGGEVVKVGEFKYLGSTIRGNKRGEEVHAGRVEWVEKRRWDHLDRRIAA